MKRYFSQIQSRSTESHGKFLDWDECAGWGVEEDERVICVIWWKVNHWRS